MEFKLEVKKYQERVSELETTVEKLQHELKLSREPKSDADGPTSSDSDTTTTVTEFTNDNVEGQSVQQHDEVNTS